MLLNPNKRGAIFLFCMFVSLCSALSQYTIEGYVYESGNRGYIQNAEIAILPAGSENAVGFATTDANGKYSIAIASPGDYMLIIIKEPYFESIESFSIDNGSAKKLFLKHEIERNPGYIFEITLAEKDASPDGPRDGLKGAMVEVYNNTKKREEQVIKSLQSPEFVIDLLKGNHYTILIRKDGFLSKRMEAFVDVEGCILCFEGIGNVRPGVSDNLTGENERGTLLANVEMDRYYEGKVIGLNNIYYDFGKSNITKAAAEELDKVALFLKDNPNLTIELGSHTDSRGNESGNLKLSKARAKSAVDYLVHKKGIHISKIEAKGYGETKLFNECSDGTDCTEEEHAQNRRTELTILDVEQSEFNRSLRQMKADELLDEILSEISDTQIKVGEGDDLQEMMKKADDDKTIIKKSVEDLQKSAPKPTNEIAETVESLKEVPSEQSKSNIKVIKPEVYGENTVEETKAVQEPEIRPEVTKSAPVTEVKDIIKESAQAKVENEVIDISAPVIKPEAPKTVELIKEKTIIKETPTVESSINEKESIETPIDDKGLDDWVNSKTIDRPKASRVNGISSQLIPFGEDYTGYKIVIHFSRFPLPKSHKILKENEDIYDYITADSNHLYMIQHFETKRASEVYLREKVIEKYPHAYIVGFEKGIRVY